MEWVTTTGRTVKEATEQALDTLGVDEADAELEVLEEPQAGLFGRTRGKAKVRARVRPRPHPPKQERRDRKRTKPSRGRGGRPDGQAAGDAEQPTTPASTEGADAPPAEVSGQDEASTESTSGRRRRRRSGGQGESDKGPEARQGAQVEPSMTLDEHVATVETFVRGLVDAFGAEADIAVVEVDDETREIQVTGDDLGLLIGPRGLTLQAVHELARTVVYRAAPDGQEGRVRIDIGGYRERRREALAKFAEKIAADVIESGVAKALEPMSPPDRKVVHDTINGIDGVATSSDGEEPRRRVVVRPVS